MQYNIDENNPERQQLLGAVLDFGTQELVELIGLIPGSRCLDVGCGIGGATRVLGKATGLCGECIGLDFDKELLSQARLKDQGDGVISFVHGDATDLPFDDDYFDIVHTRYLLIHVAEQNKVLAEMARVTKPGGIVAVYEPDLRTVSCYPESWAYQALPGIFAKAYADSIAGQKVVSLLRGAGCTSVKARARTGVEYEGSLVKRLYRFTFEATASGLVDTGEMSQAEFERMDEEFRRVESEETAFIISSPSILAWGIV